MCAVRVQRQTATITRSFFPDPRCKFTSWVEYRNYSARLSRKCQQKMIVYTRIFQNIVFLGADLGDMGNDAKSTAGGSESGQKSLCARLRYNLFFLLPVNPIVAITFLRIIRYAFNNRFSLQFEIVGDACFSSPNYYFVTCILSSYCAHTHTDRSRPLSLSSSRLQTSRQLTLRVASVTLHRTEAQHIKASGTHGCS